MQITMKKYITPESLEIEMGIHHDILSISGPAIIRDKENGNARMADESDALSNRRGIWENNDNPFGK